MKPMASRFLILKPMWNPFHGARWGSITERHILFGLTKKLSKSMAGRKLIRFLENDMGIALKPNVKKMLEDTEFFCL